MVSFMILMGPEGPEGIKTVPDNLPARLFEDKLKGKNDVDSEIKDIMSAKFAMDMRARLNSQRDLAIYYINVDSDVTEDEFTYLCLDNPKGMVKLLKEKGKKI